MDNQVKTGEKFEHTVSLNAPEVPVATKQQIPSIPVYISDRSGRRDKIARNTEWHTEVLLSTSMLSKA